MIEVWVLTLVVVPYVYMGTGIPTAGLRVQLPSQAQCEAVRLFLMDLDRMVPEKLHVGDCVRVVKERDQPTPQVEPPPPPPVSSGP